MSKIKILPIHEAQKIAAGEVVERPAHVIKELVENSLDSQATQITISIENGGKKTIRIIDNGSGMAADDLPLSITNHATSKVQSVEDLQTVTTFGFRGEGLASIAAVSKLTIISKEQEALQASRLIAHGGTIICQDELAATKGTDIIVEDLFFNLPARQKFLKKKETEWRHIIQLIHAFALSNLSVQFKLISDGQIIVHCMPAKTLEKRAAQLWHNNRKTPLYAISYSAENNHSLIINGIITDHQLVRYDRSSLYFFVNKRLVQNYQLSNALLKGFQKLIPEGRYPYAAILIEYPSNLIDINIHPRKEEIRFAHPLVINHALTQAVMLALEEKSQKKIEEIRNISSLTLSNSHNSPKITDYSSLNQWEADTSHAFFFPKKINPHIQSAQKPVTTITTEHRKPSELIASKNTDLIENVKYTDQATITQQDLVAQNAEKPLYKIIGNYDDTYLLCQHPEGLLLIDQHAAHERILYERFKNSMNIVSTELLFPELISMTYLEIECIKPYLMILEKQGIVIEVFGEQHLIIKATPVNEKRINYQELIKEIIALIQSEEALDSEDMSKKVVHILLAQMACKAAVKAGDTLTIIEMEKLVETLATTNNQQSCPHGRPISWLLGKNDIEKKFKRKL